jgi:beta-galactosidase
VKSLTQYVQAGGNLVLTCRTALMDTTGQLFDGPLAAPILPLIGGTIEACDGLTDGASAKVELDDKLYDWSIWGDLLYAEGDTKVLARYADQFYADAAAVIQKKHPKGTVTYCGVFAEQEFTSALTEHLAMQFALPVTTLPQRVQICRRGAYHFCLNYQDVPYELSVPKTARFVVGSKTVEAAGVAVWEEA